ncbi:MAG: DUF448 domain-containing protein [Sphingomonas sp.]
MRKPPNETLERKAATAAFPPSDRKEGGRAADPVRKCILSGDREARAGLIRLALGPDGEIMPDVRAKAPGRGAWIGVDRGALEEAITKGRLRGALARAFKSNALTIPADLPGLIAAALERATLDRLGLEARSGKLITGSERIETAARSGQLHLLLHAADAGVDGNRKLDQAWRIGRDEEGSDLRGLVLPVGRAILSLALGRENVVHLGLTDPDAARRTRETLDRWMHFIGPELNGVPCETASQGASAFEACGPGLADETTRGI